MRLLAQRLSVETDPQVKAALTEAVESVEASLRRADMVGLVAVERAIRKFGWEPAPLLARLASEGKTFN